MSQAELYDCCDPEVTGEGVQWAYSTCTGNKKALLIGINYVGTDNALHGCVNDALNLRKFITEKWGYNQDDITMLTDDPNVSKIRPTKANIIAQLQELVKDAQQNDGLFLFYSGHGKQIQNVDGSEADGMDEVICPVDFDEEGYIEDDYLKELVVDPLPAGCRLTVIFDCCNSGSALDLLYTYGHKGHILNGANPDDPKRSPADVVYLSGCRDDQVGIDAVEEGRATGALSHAFVENLSKEPKQSYLQMLVNTRKILKKKGYTQRPQLSSSHPIDTSLQFII
ncbi:peptidase C14 [Coprinellus micaceus]|uniref:Peptidase C14 n=1 Tax=Coprinellus micaceus TaxID=71717 RepID=A0A4Y7SFP0_COPMI|nr:peptidase C14 [Coprinellus micaceus]